MKLWIATAKEQKRDGKGKGGGAGFYFVEKPQKPSQRQVRQGYK